MKKLISFALVMMLTAATSAWATNYVKDVMLIGGSKSEVNSLKETYTGQGWTFIDYDLNKGCGSSSDFIYLLCKIESSDDLNLGYITDFYLSSQGGTAPDKLTHGERTYNLAPYAGGSHFTSKKGDLNSNASGDCIHLYYTREAFPDWRAVTSISFNTNQSGAVGKDDTTTGYDLNDGAGGDYIYMHLTTAKTKPVVVLTEDTEEVTVPDGYTITGTGSHLTHVSIADGATVTLGGITLNGKNWAATPWAGITCLGDATLILAEGSTNNIGTECEYHHEYSGIYVPEGKTLTIQGKGILNVRSVWGAGIGSGNKGSCGDITIEGGTINAQSTSGGAAIGSGEYGSCSDITIKGGTVNVQSTNGAGIGGGYQGSCGNITIEGGITQVIAYSKYDSPIGAGYGGSCGTVSIAESLNDVTEGKTRTLTPKPDWVLLTEETRDVTIPDGYTVTGTGSHLTHVCIAEGATVTLGGITLNGKNWAATPWAGITCLGDATLVLAEGTINNITTEECFHRNYPAIYVPEGNTLTIRGKGTVNAYAISGAGIGSGNEGSCGNITIMDGIVSAQSTNGAGIGSGYEGSCGDITIEGGTINAQSVNGAGIGSGNDASCGDITIKGGTINAQSVNGAGIGSGDNGSCSDITIKGGTVNVQSTNGAGIGGGYQGSCGNITIEGGITQVIAYSEYYSPIGAGYGGSYDTITIAENLNDVTEGKTRTIAPIPDGIAGVLDEQTSHVAYDLSGRQIVKSSNRQIQNGVYIVDGKKVVKR